MEARLGSLDHRDPGFGELTPIDVGDETDAASIAVRLETQRAAALEHGSETQLLDERTRPSQCDRARDRVVVEVQQVVGKARVGYGRSRHPVFHGMSLGLASE